MKTKLFEFIHERPVMLGELVMIANLILAACSPVTTDMPPTQQATESTLSEQQIATLNGLEKVDDYHLYTMHYYGSSETGLFFSGGSKVSASEKLPAAWSCSLFAAMGDADKFYGRNFDWEASPALLLFHHPTDGYDSVSMVDMSYLEIDADINNLTELPIEQRQALLEAPALPFDGMNERGLVVGMAAVPSGDMPFDPGKEMIDSLMVIRKMLDQAGDVNEAVAILGRYNIDWDGGPPLHYLIADRSGRAVLAEFYQGKSQLIPNDKPWHFATNFLVSAVNGSTAGQCTRYDRLEGQLSTAEGSIDAGEAMSLLKDVSQANTQWSIVYGFSTGDITVTMGQQYDRVHTFHIDLME